VVHRWSGVTAARNRPWQLVAAGKETWVGRRKAAAAVQTAAGGTPQGVKDHPMTMQINNTTKIVK